MPDWKEYKSQLMTNIAATGRVSPETVRGYRGLIEADSKTLREANTHSNN